MELHTQQWALIFFGLAATVGLIMLRRYYRKLPRRNLTMLIHGIFAAAGICLLFYYSAFEQNANVPYLSIFFFILAVFGGITMAMWDKVMNRKLPRYFPLFHAGAAVSGIISLIIHLMNH